MQTTNYLEKAKSFLAQKRSLALRAAPLALVAVAAAQASPTFNAPNNNGVTQACPASSGGSATGSFGGSATNSGLGLTLSGNATLFHTGVSENCTYTLKWRGTGTGNFAGSTATIAALFSITPPANATISGYSLNVLINGATQKQITCTAPGAVVANVRGLTPKIAVSCSGSVTVPSQTFPVPQTLTTYEVDLAINTSWTNSASGTALVNVPSGQSIDILAQAGPPVTPTVPVMSPLAMVATALLLAFGAMQLSRQKTYSAPRE